MSTFPLYSDLPAHVQKELGSRRDNISKISKLNAWVRVSSGVDAPNGSGMMLYSNPDYKIFKAAGDGNVSTLYGNTSTTSTIGVTWAGSAIETSVGTGNSLMPSPIVESVEIDQGEGGISRTATVSIKVFTKEQLEVISKYYMEPGYTIFIEIGWNDPASLSGFASTLNASHIAQYQEFSLLNKRRADTKGMYENYLGYITGGTVSSQGTEFTVQVKCTGFAELPATIPASDNSDKDSDSTKLEKSYYFTPSKITGATDEGKKRFMLMFNELPSNRRTALVKNLIDVADVADPGNFINFDETVRAEINKKSDVGFWGRLFGQAPSVEAEAPPEGGGGTTTVELKEGTEIVQPNRYIRFGTLMTIFNSFGVDSVSLGGTKQIKYAINSKECIAGAFLNIFSIDGSKLFIPNDYTPKFSLASAQAGKIFDPLEDTGRLPQNDESVKTSAVDIFGGTAQFPSLSTYKKQTSSGASAVIPAGQWGYIDNLYVNFDFVKEIMQTPNLLVKDALYEILNGMSSAVNGMWNFQIVESSTEISGNSEASELTIIDANLPLKSGNLNGVFEIQGTDSIFQDVSLDIDLTGAKMNQIIAERSNITVAESKPSAKSAIFSENKDLVIEILRKQAASTDDATQEPETTDDEELKEKNVELFMERIVYVPRADLTASSKDTIQSKTYESTTYVAAYADSVVFNSLKHGSSIYESTGVSNNFGPLLPIKCSFTVHGISGINRGQKFLLRGIPDKYQNNGFFQITSVKQVVSGMMWKTEVTGEFRPRLGAPK